MENSETEFVRIPWRKGDSPKIARYINLEKIVYIEEVIKSGVDEFGDAFEECHQKIYIDGLPFPVILESFDMLAVDEFYTIRNNMGALS